MEYDKAIEYWKSLPLNPWRMGKLVLHACKTDDVPLMAQVLSMAGQGDSSVMAQEVLQKALTRVGKKNAMRCLAYILEQGADISHLDYDYAYPDLADGPSREALELLVAYGWNVNTGLDGHSGTSLLWDVVRDRELVQWCLDHGADVHPPDHTPPGRISRRTPLLERAACVGDIDTFELLRARGAPMHYGVFPSAVMSANGWSAEDKDRFAKQMRMLRHLLEVVKCDINEYSYGPHYASGSVCVNPLCWIACHPRPNGTTAETEELICFLLENGGDPDMTMEHKGYSNDDGVLIQSARESARQRPNPFFLRIVEEWEAKNGSRASKDLYATE
jgi:hypothetical protein